METGGVATGDGEGDDEWDLASSVCGLEGDRFCFLGDFLGVCGEGTPNESPAFSSIQSMF